MPSKEWLVEFTDEFGRLYDEHVMELKKDKRRGR